MSIISLKRGWTQKEKKNIMYVRWTNDWAQSCKRCNNTNQRCRKWHKCHHPQEVLVEVFCTAEIDSAIGPNGHAKAQLPLLHLPLLPSSSHLGICICLIFYLSNFPGTCGRVLIVTTIQIIEVIRIVDTASVYSLAVKNWLLTSFIRGESWRLRRRLMPLSALYNPCSTTACCC